MDERLGDFISHIETSKNLPSLPHILVKLVKACQNENASLQDISRIISADSFLTAKVLRLANSCYYRPSEKVVIIDQALMRMGRDAIKNLAVSAAVHQVFNTGVRMASGFDMKRFWRHSLMCAILARMIAEKSAFNVPEQAFLAGMIHDIGRLILVTNLPQEYEQILAESKDSSSLLMEQEIKAGIPHTEVGAWLLNRWNLDSMTSDAVLYHHEPVERIKDAFPLVKIVFAANVMSCVPASFRETSDVIKHLFPFSLSEANDMTLQAEAEVKELAESLGIQISERDVLSQEGEEDREKEEELIHNVRDISLLVGVLQNLAAAPEEDAMLKIMQQGICILFDVQRIVFFLYDNKKGVMSARIVRDDGHIDSPDGLTIPLSNGESILVQSLQKQAILSSFSSGKSKPLTIMDKQVLHFLEKEGMLCLPLVADKEPVGLMVMGISQPEEEVLVLQERLLSLLANHAAIAIHLERYKKNQAMKIASERLSASTALARRIVHEANNPLGIIKNYLKILVSRLGEESPVQNEVRIIGEEIERIVRILRELSDFSKSKVREKAAVHVNALLDDIVRIISKSLPGTSQIKIHTDLLSSLPKIRGDQDGLKQVFINLIKNAIEALSDRGNIFIETMLMSERDTIPKGGVKVVISDDGPGLPSQVESRVFEPYTSTKGSGHSGIGLSIVHNIIKDHGGTVTYCSTAGKGATFIITLPVHSA